MPGVSFTICGYCGCNCGVNLRPETHGQVSAVPSQAAGAGGGRLCLRGWQTGDLSPGDRQVSQPQVLRNGEQVATDWSEAVQAAAEGLGRITPSDTQSLGVLCSGHLTNEEAFAAQEFARDILGATSIDNLGRALNGAAIWGIESALHEGCRSPSLPTLGDSDAVLVLNANLPWESPQAAAWIVRARRKGASVILLDEVGGGFAAHSDTVLIHRPGTRGAALLLLLNALGGVPPRGSAEKADVGPTGLAAERIETAAGQLRGAARASIVFSASAIQRVQDAYLIGQLCAILSSKTPHKDVLYAIPSDCNACGVTQMGMSPSVTDSGDRSLSAAEMLNGSLRGLVVLDAGLEAFIGSDGLRRLREKAEFICAISPHESETTAIADVVLPMSGWGARAGTITGCDGQIWGIPSRLGTDHSRPLLTTLADIAAAMGKQAPSVRLADVRARISSTVVGYTNVGWNFVDTGQPDTVGPRYSAAVEDHGDLAGAPIAPVPIAGEDPGRPLTLIVRRDDASWAFDPRVRAAPILERELAPRRAPYVTMGADTATDTNLRPGRPAVLQTVFGQAEAALQVQRGVPDGVVLVPWHCRDLVFALCGPGEIDARTGTSSHGPVAASVAPPQSA